MASTVPTNRSLSITQTQEERVIALLTLIGYIRSPGRGNKEDVYVNHNSFLAGQNQCFIGTVNEVLKLDPAMLKKLIKEKTDDLDTQMLNLVKNNVHTSSDIKEGG